MSVVTGINGNTSLATAQSLDGNFSRDFDANIENSTTVPHLTVNAVTEGAIDYYSLTITKTSFVTLDIDGAIRRDANGSYVGFNSLIIAKKSTGKSIASADNSSFADPGSTPYRSGSGTYDSFLTLFLAPGTYSFLVGGAWYYSSSLLSPVSVYMIAGPDEQQYKLNISVSSDAPATPVIALSNDTGTSNADKVTRNGGLRVVNAETNATLEYSIDGGTTWSRSFTAREGANSVRARQTDAYGQTSAASAAYTFTLDTQAPTITITSTGGAVDQARQIVAGTASLDVVGQTVRVMTGSGALLGTAVVGTDGTWATSINLPGFGNQIVMASVSDAAGNEKFGTNLVYNYGAVPLLTSPGAITGANLVHYTLTFNTAVVNGLTTNSFLIDGWDVTGAAVTSVTRVSGTSSTVT